MVKGLPVAARFAQPAQRRGRDGDARRNPRQLVEQRRIGIRGGVERLDSFAQRLERLARPHRAAERRFQRLDGASLGHAPALYRTYRIAIRAYGLEIRCRTWRGRNQQE